MPDTIEIYETIDPKKIAKALSEYIEKYGLPPAVCESIEIKVDGGWVYINPWSVKETT